MKTLLLCGAAGVTAFALSGCQNHPPRALDLEAHLTEVAARDPAHESVREWAARLRDANGGASPFDPADGLSLAEGEAVALVFNPELRLARLRAGVTAAAAAHAGLWADPVLGTDFVRILESTANPWKVFATIGFTIPISGRLEAEKAQRGAEHAAELARVHEAEWAMRAALRRDWIEWSAALRRGETLTQALGQLDRLVEIVGRIEAAGEMSRIESRLFRIQRAALTNETQRAINDTAERRLLLLRRLGFDPGSSMEFVPSALSDAEVSNLDPSARRAAMFERSAALATARVEYEVAERALALELRRQYPDLQVGPGYGREDGQDQALLNLSIPLPILNRNQQGIAIALSKRDLAQANFEATSEGLASELASRLRRVIAARERRLALERDVLPMVEEQMIDTRRVAEIGEFNPLVLLESSERERAARLLLIDAMRDEALAGFDAIEIVGPEPEPALNAETAGAGS